MARFIPEENKISFSIGDQEYILVTQKSKFKSARRQARSLGGDLVEINNQAENQAIFDAITGLLNSEQLEQTTASDGGGSAYVWLGGKDTVTEGSWFWVASRTPIGTDRAEWGEGALGSEPDNFNGNQNHLAMGLENWPYGSSANQGFGNAGSWNDISGQNKLFFVVELN